jgi:hypothetical protein
MLNKKLNGERDDEEEYNDDTLLGDDGKSSFRALK